MKHQHGFTLIEIAIVLLISGLLLGGLMTPLATQFENAKRNETRQTLEDISETLYGFALTKGYLPCPDTDNDGLENRLAGGACAAPSGILPWVTLNIGKSDAWGRRFIYGVADMYADKTSPFSLSSIGDIEVWNAVGGSKIADKVPALVLSQGANGAAGGVDENENSDNDAVFVSREYSTLQANPFDDMVEWVVPGILNNQMVKAGKWQ